MVRTNTNEDLIKEIDGGIKKEVSISCTAKTHKCSICGKDKYDKGCNHINGKYYGGKLCYTILDDITDAYEWSFVAVPAQVNAGVVKHFGELNTQSVTTLENPTINALAEDLKKDIIRLGFLKNDTSNVLHKHMDMLSLEDLITLKNDLLSKPNPNEKVVSQLRFESSKSYEDLNDFKL
jgi:hypothetical protein